MPVLCRFIAWKNRHHPEIAPQLSIEQGLKFLTDPPVERSQWLSQVKPFLFSYYTQNDLLLIGPVDGKKKLFLVKSSDAARDPKDAMVRGLQKDLDKKDRDYLDQRRINQSIWDKNLLLQSEVKKLKDEQKRLTRLLKKHVPSSIIRHGLG